MQLRKYPPILPATPLQREGENSTPVQRDLPKDQPQNKHGGGKQIACNECRRRKTKASRIMFISIPFFLFPLPTPHSDYVTRLLANSIIVRWSAAFVL